MLIFCESEPCPSRYKTQGGTREQFSKSSFSRHCLHFILTLCPCAGLWFSAAFSSCFHLAPASVSWFPALCHIPVPLFCLDIYLSPGCPPASVDCCNKWLWYLLYFIPTTFWITEIQPFGVFTHFPSLRWMPGCRTHIALLSRTFPSQYGITREVSKTKSFSQHSFIYFTFEIGKDTCN